MVTSPAPFRIRPIDFSFSSPPRLALPGPDLRPPLEHKAPRFMGTGNAADADAGEEGIPFSHVLRDPLRPVSHFHWTLSPADDPGETPTSVLRAHERKVVAVILLSRLDVAWPKPSLSRGAGMSRYWMPYREHWPETPVSGISSPFTGIKFPFSTSR
jgi:hypothetical protein